MRIAVFERDASHFVKAFDGAEVIFTSSPGEAFQFESSSDAGNAIQAILSSCGRSCTFAILQVHEQST